jgi:sortase A
MPRLNARRCLAAVSLAVAAFCLGQAIWIHAKARLAQWLIAAAWERGVAAQAPLRPWPWVDTYPIARLTIGKSDTPLYVLENASGQSLAFGPAHDMASAMPGERGNSVIEAHRDTHFATLKAVTLGTEIALETRAGVSYYFRVSDVAVVDSRRARIALGGTERRLTLVTCYPFDAVRSGGPLRLVVSAIATNGI